MIRRFQRTASASANIRPKVTQILSFVFCPILLFKPRCKSLWNAERVLDLFGFGSFLIEFALYDLESDDDHDVDDRFGIDFAQYNTQSTSI